MAAVSTEVLPSSASKDEMTDAAVFPAMQNIVHGCWTFGVSPLLISPEA